jgi:hypothetical protein
MIKQKPAIKALMRQIAACEKRIAAERDTLRDLESTAATLADNCQQAIDGLTQAADCLSELV